MRRIVIALVALMVVVFGACQFMPERYAVNAPIAPRLVGFAGEAPERAQFQQRMQAAQGFKVSVWASGLAGARMLAITAEGNLLVSLPRQGKVVLIETGANGEALPARDLLTDLDRPHGLAITAQWLYIAEGTAIDRVRIPAAGLSALIAPEDLQRIITGLPDGGNHWSRSVASGPDGRLYISVGSSCNVCEESDQRRASMLVADADGGNLKVYATGLRNSVGYDWHPVTHELFATDNGRDLLGDDFPPCELNRVVEGGFYGWPYANGNQVPDPDFGDGQMAQIERSIAPAFSFPAHTAPLGMTFLHSEDLPADYRRAALVALHGSWNRTSKSGYKVVSLHWQQDGGIESRDFLTGFEIDEKVIGRPVDIVEASDGAIYISDDFAGVIWRVTR